MNGVTGTNPSALTASDGMLDPALRQLCRDSLGALSPNGPTAAYEYFAKQTERTDGTLIPVNRTKLGAVSSTGLVTLTVASENGPVDGADVTTIQTNLAKLALPAGKTLSVASATTTGITVDGELFVNSKNTQSNAEIEALVNARLDAYMKAVPIGGLQKVSGQGKVWKDAITGQIFQALGDIIEIDLSSPAGDTTITSTQVPVYIPPASWTITRVAQT